MSDAIVLIGGGRHCHNIVGHLEMIGFTISHILDDDPRGPVLGYEVRPLETGLRDVRRAHLAVGDPAKKRQIVARCRSFRQIEWVTVRHPNAVVSPHASVADGCFIGPFVTTGDVVLEEQATVLPFTLLGARVNLGACSLVSSHCSIHSDVQVGSETIIGSGVQVTAGVRIGARCRIAPNSVVNKDIPEDHLVVTSTRTRIVPVATRSSQEGPPADVAAAHPA